MKHRLPERELSELTLALIVAGLIGWFLGITGWAVAAVLVLYLWRSLRDLERLRAWLRHPEQDLPDSHGSRA